MSVQINSLRSWNASVGEKRRTFPMARPKCLMGNFPNLYRIYKAHQTNVWWTMKVFRLHSIAHKHLWIGSSLVQVMACWLSLARPLPEPMLNYCQLGPNELVRCSTLTFLLNTGNPREKVKNIYEWTFYDSPTYITLSYFTHLHRFKSLLDNCITHAMLDCSPSRTDPI